MTDQQIVLFEDDGFVSFLPLTYWRSVFELRYGREILLDRIAQALGQPIAGVWTRDRLAPIAAQRCGAPANAGISENTILVNGRWVVEPEASLPEQGPVVGMIGDEVAYIVCDSKLAADLAPRDLVDKECRMLALQDIPTQDARGRLLHYPWDCVAELADALRLDWSDSDAGVDTPLEKRPQIDDPSQVHIGERSTVHPTAVLDTTNGPVYISLNVQVGAHAVIEGPAYIGPGCKINTHAWLHGGVSLGPVCKVGGEVDGCIMLGYANKQHSGFLGHSYVGNWVNIGAGACNSDLKNTYGNVRVTVAGQEIDTGPAVRRCDHWRPREDWHHGSDPNRCRAGLCGCDQPRGADAQERTFVLMDHRGGHFCG